MSMLEILEKRGYKFRKHTEEFGLGIPSVVDFDLKLREVLKYEGIDGLEECLKNRMYSPPWGLWTFPSFDIKKNLPRRPDVVLAQDGKVCCTIVVPENSPIYMSFAKEFVDEIKTDYGIELCIVDENAVQPEALEKQHLILFGGSHQNRMALELALKYRTMFVDAGVPGEDGWIVTTHCGLNARGHNIAQVCSDADNKAKVMDILKDNVAEYGLSLLLRNVHRVEQGSVMKQHFPSWENYKESLPGRVPHFKGKDVEAPDDLQELSELLALGFDGGTFGNYISNTAPVDIAVGCAHYYHLSGDERALELFHKLLFRLVDYYLKTPGGASYPSDLDFRVGVLILYYSRLEHLPLFSEEDRLLLGNMLLSCTRAVHEHAFKNWAVEDYTVRHNHETFPALSLTYASEYFSRFNVDEINHYIATWDKYSKQVFEKGLWNRSKQKENSRSYEPFVYNHAASYSFFTGCDLQLFSNGMFRQLCEREFVATDNFFRAVDYGDTPIKMQAVDSVSARLLAARQDGTIRWFAGEGFRREPRYTGKELHDYPGIRLHQEANPPESGEWENRPLDENFMNDFAPDFPHEFAFDKLAFRTGWNDEDQYLLLEGVGEINKISHAHYETNGIVRLNHLGRHWIVSNGYGKRIGVKDRSKAFSSRQLGPLDHNMLILKDEEGKIVRDLPMNALIQLGQEKDILYSTSALLGYGHANWFRTLVVNSGEYVLVIDRIQALDKALEKAHIEWNCLGKVSEMDGGFRIEQDGIFMDIISPSDWPAEQRVADQSLSWKQALNPGVYPYAEFPLTKLVSHAPGIGAGRSSTLVNLLAAHRGTSEYSLESPRENQVIVKGPVSASQRTKVVDGDLSVNGRNGQCDVRFADVPDLPAPFKE